MFNDRYMDIGTKHQLYGVKLLTAHFIDGAWKMHKRILNFCVISNHHGTTIGKILEGCLVQWRIDKVLTVSVDNAASNKGAIEYLRKKMAGWKQPPVFGGKYLHVRCLAHILNLIVKAGLKLMDKAIASIRNAIKYVRSSSARLDCFRMCVENEQLESKKVCILDVPTRWNSTYLMLETALELRPAFDRLAEEEEQKYYSYFDEDEEEDEEEDGLAEVVSKKRVGPPVEMNWEKAEVFVKFLKVFYDVTMRISASTKPTSQKAFHDIVAVQVEIDALFKKPEMQDGSETERVLTQMVVTMKAKFRKYFKTIEDVNQLLLVALVLDPRFKLRNFSHICHKMLGYDEQEVRSSTTAVKQLLVGLTDLYASSVNVTAPAPSMSKSCSVLSDIPISSSNSMTGKMAEMLNDWEKELEQSCEVVVESEVDRYLLDPIEKPPKGSDFDILVWWKLNGSKYPNLAAVARDVLAIQVSTVASESSFSTGKRVIDPFRSSLTPRSVEALICLQNWIRSEGHGSIEYYPTMEEMKFYEGVEAEILDAPANERNNQGSKSLLSKKAGKAGKVSKSTTAATPSRVGGK